MTCLCRTPGEHAKRQAEVRAYNERAAAEHARKKTAAGEAEASRRITELSERSPNPDEFKILLETRGEAVFADLLRMDARERGGLRWRRHRLAPSRPIVGTPLMELASWVHANRLSVDDAPVSLLERAASHVAGRLRLLSCRAQSARTRAQARWLAGWKIRVHDALRSAVAADDAAQTERLTP